MTPGRTQQNTWKYVAQLLHGNQTTNFIKRLQRTYLSDSCQEGKSKIHQSTNDAAAASVDVPVPHGKPWKPSTKTSRSDRRAHRVQIAVSPLDLTQLFVSLQWFRVKKQVVLSPSQHFPALFYISGVKQIQSSPAQIISNLSLLDPSSRCKRALINNPALDLVCFGTTNPTYLLIRHFIVLEEPDMGEVLCLKQWRTLS